MFSLLSINKRWTSHNTLIRLVNYARKTRQFNTPLSLSRIIQNGEISLWILLFSFAILRLSKTIEYKLNSTYFAKNKRKEEFYFSKSSLLFLNNNIWMNVNEQTNNNFQHQWCRSIGGSERLFQRWLATSSSPFHLFAKLLGMTSDMPGIQWKSPWLL